MMTFGRDVAFLGGTAAAVLAGIYILWGPSGKKKSNRATCPGLVNLGNTCFLNAVLQALAPCTSVVQWLADFASKYAARHHHRNYLAEPMLDVLKALNNEGMETKEEVCATEVLDALKVRRWVISSDEQDAHEMFHVLTETLDEEAARYPSVASLFDADSIEDSSTVQLQPDSVARHKHGIKLPVIPNREADHPFRGLLASQLQCATCAYKCPVKYDTFDSLSLSIPNNLGKYGTLTLDELLRHYIMSETVPNVECEGCALKMCRQSATERSATTRSPPPPKTTFVKKLTLGKLPQCLCIHVQRTVWLNSGLPMKKYDHIHFPEVLNMNSYSYHRRQKCPPTTLPGLDLDFGAGLVGGRKNINGFTQGHTKRLGATSPTITVPYSGPVNLLKALNYHTRTTTMGGLSMQAPVPRPDQNSAGVQQLVHAYSAEVLSPLLGTTSNAYKLTAVVVHHGDVFSGHFVTYRRAPSTNGLRFPNRWLHTSDTTVKKVTLADVMRTNAYMLFYEKI